MVLWRRFLGRPGGQRPSPAPPDRAAGRHHLYERSEADDAVLVNVIPIPRPPVSQRPGRSRISFSMATRLGMCRRYA